MIVVTVTLALAAAALPANGPSADRWIPVRRDQQRGVELVLDGTDVTARIGCTAIGFRVHQEGEQLKAQPPAVIHEAPCFPSDRKRPAAEWNRVVDVLSDPAILTFDAERRLTVKDTSGRIIKFKRSKGE